MRGFTGGMILGGIVGAALSMMSNANGNMKKSRKKMMKSGRNMLRKSGRLIADITDMIS